jgi:hypothetical protein
MFESKDIVLTLAGLAAGVAGNYIFKHMEQSGDSNENIERDLRSTDFLERGNAIRSCLLNAAKWYIIANMFWVVSGAAWVLDAFDQVAVRVVLGATSLLSIVYFWLALRWIVRVFKSART